MNNEGQKAMVNEQWAMNLSLQVIQRLIPRWPTLGLGIGTA
jgi:hypothetical protein